MQKHLANDPGGVAAGIPCLPSSIRSHIMSTYFKLHYHIVFATKRRVACLDKAWRAQLWEYMGGTVRGLGGVPHGVGGYNDHVHLLIDLKPTQLLPDVVRELKKASTEWIRTHLLGCDHSNGRKAMGFSRSGGGKGKVSRITSPGRRNIMAIRTFTRNTRSCCRMLASHSIRNISHREHRLRPFGVVQALYLSG